jgi:hypothetical protein
MRRSRSPLRAPWLLPLLGLCAGCVEVSGGAVEARWDLRDPNGVRIPECTSTPVVNLRFALAPLGGGADPCNSEPSCRFACDLKTGATHFVIPEGDYSASLVALDASGRSLGPPAVVAPEPVTRTVLEGKVTDLSVNLIIVTP